MFTWICPQCGKEVPPAYTDCPNCAEKAAQAAQQAQAPAVPAAQPEAAPAYVPPAPFQQPAAQYPPPAPPQYQAPPYPAPPYQPQGPPPPYNYPPQQPPQYAPQQPPPGYWMPQQPKRGLPTWLLTVLVAAGTAVVIFGAIWLFSAHTESKPSTAVENPAAKPGAATNPVQRNIEVSGVRFDVDPKNKSKILVKFVITNHSGMDLSGLAGNVTLWGSTHKSDEDAQGSFSFATNLRPFESKDMQAPLTTKLKIYEMPDWQAVTSDVQITAPVVQ
jgi:hypothetical protein